MNASKTAGTGWEARQLRQTIKLAVWTAAWVGTAMLATYGAEFLWDDNRTFSALAIAVNLVIGLRLVLVQRDYHLSLDEMQQRMYLEAMGFALGIGVVAGIAYAMLDTTNVIAGDANIGVLVALMGLIYLGGVIYGNWKVR